MKSLEQLDKEEKIKKDIETKVFQRLYNSTYGNAFITKEEIKTLTDIIPTKNKNSLICRQKGHPYGDWELFKINKQYFVRTI